MAKCEKRELKPEPPPVEYVLTLTAQEAQQLKHIVAGAHDDDLTTVGIWKALDDADVLDGVGAHAYIVRRV
jgi:hypothetical protein